MQWYLHNTGEMYVCIGEWVCRLNSSAGHSCVKYYSIFRVSVWYANKVKYKLFPYSLCLKSTRLNSPLGKCALRIKSLIQSPCIFSLRLLWWNCWWCIRLIAVWCPPLAMASLETNTLQWANRLAMMLRECLVAVTHNPGLGLKSC